MNKIIEYFKGAADWAHAHEYTVGCYGGSYLLKTLFDQKVIDFGAETTAWCYHFHEPEARYARKVMAPTQRTLKIMDSGDGMRLRPQELQSKLRNDELASEGKSAPTKHALQRTGHSENNNSAKEKASQKTQ
jgi:hypothetical protein